MKCVVKNGIDNGWLGLLRAVVSWYLFLIQYVSNLSGKLKSLHFRWVKQCSDCCQ